jgi:uncharacterized protein YndB with AHSA1/START domain
MSKSSMDRIQRTITIDAPPIRVWRALTDYREFGAWFRVNLEGPFVPGQSVKGQVTYPGYEHLVMEVWVRDMVSNVRFSFEWHPHDVEAKRPESEDARTLVEFRLEASGSGTRLTVTESGFDKLPAGWRDEAFRLNSRGWDEQVENIRAYVNANS